MIKHKCSIEARHIAPNDGIKEVLKMWQMKQHIYSKIFRHIFKIYFNLTVIRRHGKFSNQFNRRNKQNFKYYFLKGGIMASCSFLPDISVDCQSHNDWIKMCNEFYAQSNFSSYMKVVDKLFRHMGIIGTSPLKVTINKRMDYSKHCVLAINEIEVEYTISYNRHQHLSKDGTMLIFYNQGRNKMGTREWFPFSMDMRELYSDKNAIENWILKRYHNYNIIEPNQYHYTYTHSKFRFIFRNEKLLFVDETRWSDGHDEKIKNRFWNKKYDRMNLTIKENFKNNNHIVF